MANVGPTMGANGQIHRDVSSPDTEASVFWVFLSGGEPSSFHPPCPGTPSRGHGLCRRWLSDPRAISLEQGPRSARVPESRVWEGELLLSGAAPQALSCPARSFRRGRRGREMDGREEGPPGKAGEDRRAWGSLR